MNKDHLFGVDLNLLRVFDRIYVERSVGRAAVHLGLTQSAVSHGLRRLRSLFGDPLFVRSGMGMSPTPRAHALHDPIRRVMDLVANEVLAGTRFDAKAARREFSLTMMDLAEGIFIPPLLQRLRRDAPGCTLRITRISSRTMAEALERDEVELAVGTLVDPPGHLYSRTVFMHDYMVLAWKRHPRLSGVLTWRAYQREPHVVIPSGADAHLREHVLGPRGIERKVVLSLTGYFGLPWILKGTDLIATVPPTFARTLNATHGLVCLQMPERPKPYALQTVWHPRWHMDPGHRWIRDLLAEVMTSVAGETRGT